MPLAHARSTVLPHDFTVQEYANKQSQVSRFGNEPTGTASGCGIMKRRVWWSLLGGIILNIVFYTLSAIVVRFFPYKDKPGMPNDFTWFLIPGLMVGSLFDGHDFLPLAVMITVNSLIYGFAVFCLLTIAKKVFASSH
jgi:hypothetical protein